ncbi:hypothetical protein ACFYKX_04295 [Cytobacillus sp. FJAT-54145]|uniref:Uncharacterized protein n=1 Tax=Cytobacillus spartinae TaxID=3299023 RepID=A0ABW6K6N2_9BACI
MSQHSDDQELVFLEDEDEIYFADDDVEIEDQTSDKWKILIVMMRKRSMKLQRWY